MSSPDFPGRPVNVSNSADFWRLSETVVDNDTAIDKGLGIEEFLVDKVYVEALVYVATQRIERLLERAGIPETLDELRAHIGAAWLDGFAAGQGFEQKGGHQTT